jgi:hypothetical protein
MNRLACVLWSFGVVVTTALAGGESTHAGGAERGVNDPPLGYVNRNFSIDRTNVLVGRGRLTPGQVDNWGTFLAANQTLVVITTPLSGLPQSFNTPDTLVSIRDSSGVLVSNDNAGADIPLGTSRGSIVRFIAPQQGSYTVRVEGVGGNQTGEYAIHIATIDVNYFDWLAQSNNQTPATADFVPLGEIGPNIGFAELENPVTLDYYRVDLNFGDILIASANPLANVPFDWNVPDMRMRIVGPDGVTALLTTNSDAAGTLPASADSGATVRFRAPARGSYYVFVDDTQPRDGGIYSYALLLARIPAASCPGDADGSGTVSFLDITTVLANFGNTCP